MGSERPPACGSDGKFRQAGSTRPLKIRVGPLVRIAASARMHFSVRGTPSPNRSSSMALERLGGLRERALPGRFINTFP